VARVDYPSSLWIEGLALSGGRCDSLAAEDQLAA